MPNAISIVLKPLIFKIIHFHRCFYLQEDKTNELKAVRSSLPQLEEKLNNISLKVSGQFLQQPRLLLFLCVVVVIVVVGVIVVVVFLTNEANFVLFFCCFAFLFIGFFVCSYFCLFPL